MVMRLLRALLPGLVVVCLVPWVALAQRRNPNPDASIRLYSLRGHVRLLENESAVEMIRIELRRFTGEMISTTFSRANGEFEFSGVPNGNFVITVDENGYEPVREQVEVANSSRIGIAIYLRKISVPGAESAGSSVSVRELALPTRLRDSFQKALQRLYGKKDFAAAAQLLRKVVAEAPDFSEGFLHLGIALTELGELDAAEQAFRRAIETNGGNDTEPFFALASLLSNRNKFQEAEELARRGISVNSNRWQGHYELARALHALNKNEEAEKSALVARRLKSDYAPTYLLLANLHLRKKDYAAVLEDLEEYLRLEPDGPMSAQARKMRDAIKPIVQGQASTPGTPVKP
jgi:tetratricopeptide (TPR) repeat protein